METRILSRPPGHGALAEPTDSLSLVPSGWTWVDIDVVDSSADEVAAFMAGFDFDLLAIADAVDDFDHPKVDDFGATMLVVLHGLSPTAVETFEVDCFLADGLLVTVHAGPAPGLEALWQEVQQSAAAASGTVDVLLARLADVLTRRLMSVLEEFDDVVDELIAMALEADGRTIGEVTAIRSDLTAIRRIVHPQRETVDQLRSSASPLIGSEGRRRFSDVFDLADRTATELVTARSVLAETLDAYRGAEARKATDVTKVLTVYAAILLPLSLITGFFGMNFSNLPGLESEAGWIVVVAVMALIAFVSIGVFVSVGWISRPSGRRAGETLGRGLVEAARAPVQIGGAVFEISTMPLRAASPFRGRTGDESDQPDTSS